MKAILTGAVAAALILSAVGCKSTSHPNQINQFDGASFDSLVAAHSALETLRVQVVSKYPKYKGDFNIAAAAYNTARDTYATFRQAPAQNQAQVAAEIGNVTVSLVALENSIQQDLHVSPDAVAKARANALKQRQRLYRTYPSAINVTDILTDLEIAASVAQAVPVAAPYAALASLVIEATSEAIASLSAQSGQPIDLSAIPEIAVIPA